METTGTIGFYRGIKLGLYRDSIGVSQIKGTILGVPIIRIIVFWGLYWRPII